MRNWMEGRGSVRKLGRPRVEETVALTTPRSRDILGAVDTLVDIGAFAEKEVIQ